MNASLSQIEDGRIARTIRELQSNLDDMVESGDMTDEQANDWFNTVADRLAQGLN